MVFNIVCSDHEDGLGACQKIGFTMKTLKVTSKLKDLETN